MDKRQANTLSDVLVGLLKTKPSINHVGYDTFLCWTNAKKAIASADAFQAYVSRYLLDGTWEVCLHVVGDNGNLQRLGSFGGASLQHPDCAALIRKVVTL